MVDSVKTKHRIEKILRIYPNIQEITPINDNFSFTLQISFFNNDMLAVIIDYMPSLDIIRVCPRVVLTTNIKNKYDKKTDDEKVKICSLFNKTMREHKFNGIINKDDLSIMACIKILFNQNLSAQKLIDIVDEGKFVLLDILDMLISIDRSLDIPKIDNTDSMFR